MLGADGSDEDLMRRYAAGERHVFEVLYRRHEARVFRYLLRQVHEPAAANDLMQDVWLSVVRSASRYQATAKFTTWLYTLTRHRVIDWYRRARPGISIDCVSGETGASAYPELVADVRSEPHRVLQSRQDRRALITAVEQLPFEQREAFLLQAEGELSVEDIATITGSSFETVKSRLRYARTKLRQLLQEYA